jgi:hypothetical protein
MGCISLSTASLVLLYLEVLSCHRTASRVSCLTLYNVTDTGSQLPVMDSHYLRTINYTENTPDFALEAPLCLLLVTFQLLYRFRRALSPYMVQETLMADGSASEVLQTHVQRRRHSRLTSSTSTAL